MSPLVKACNVRSPDDLSLLDASRVNIAGIRALANGRGSLPTEQICQLVHTGRDLRTDIALLTDRLDLDQFFDELKIDAPDYLVLHSIHDCKTIELARSIHPTVQVGSLLPYRSNTSEIQRLLEIGADFLVCDWLAGGTGLEYDQRTIDRVLGINPSSNLMIAGGLHPFNVDRVVREYQPFALDVDSGLRSGELKGFDERIVQTFVNRVKSAAAMSENQENIGGPYRKASESPWASICSEILDKEEVVAKLRFLSKLDDTDRYVGAQESLSDRISKSLRDLRKHPDVPDRWLHAAMCAFANTLYLPNELLQSSIRYLYMRVWNQTKDTNLTENPFHIFFNDPGGLGESFFRVNRLHGRLDQDKYIRINGVEQLGSALLNAQIPDHPLFAADVQKLRDLVKRDTWVILADQTLSGHSLIGDLEKIIWLNERLADQTGKKAKLVVCAQIATHTALASLRKSPIVRQQIESDVLTIEYAIGLDRTYDVSDRCCEIINDPEVLEDLRELCVWFADEFIKSNDDLSRMRRKSGDNLEFGYRSAGLLLSRQDNCPTDSLPLLWHSGQGRSGINYEGPYPRTHSRIGEQPSEQTSGLWDAVLKTNDLSWASNIEKSSND